MAPAPLNFAVWEEKKGWAGRSVSLCAGAHSLLLPYTLLSLQEKTITPSPTHTLFSRTH